MPGRFFWPNHFYIGGALMQGYPRGARLIVLITVAFFILAAGGCSKTIISHSLGLSRNFGELFYYTWASPSVLDVALQDTLVGENVQVIAGHELSLKGYEESADHADFVISIAYSYEDFSPLSYRLSMLTLNIYGNEGRELLWRGTASGSISIDMASGELYQAVRDILARFPHAVAWDIQLSNRGFSYLQQGEYAQAEHYLERALGENPDNPYALLNMGAVYQNTGRDEEARSAYERLIMLNPPDVAVVSSDSGAKGKTLVDIAKENLEKLQ